MKKKKNKFNLQTKASCFPLNNQQALTKAQLSKSPCANGQIFNEKLSDDALQRDYQLSGESNYETCKKEVNKLFESDKPCVTGTDLCSYKTARVPDIKNNKFLAFSSFWYALSETSRLWNTSFDGDFKGFSQATKDMCLMNIDEVSERNTCLSF